MILEKRPIESLVLSTIFLLFVYINLRVVVHSSGAWTKNGVLVLLLSMGVLLYTGFCFLSLFRVIESKALFHPFVFLMIMFLSMLAVFYLSGYRVLSFIYPEVPSKPAKETIVLNVIKASGLYLSMLFGMVADGLWNDIGRKKHLKQVSIATAQLVKPMLVSPIVFLFIWTLLRDQPFGIVHLLVAFQNGFFWQSVLARHRSPRKTERP